MCTCHPSTYTIITNKSLKKLPLNFVHLHWYQKVKYLDINISKCVKFYMKWTLNCMKEIKDLMSVHGNKFLISLRCSSQLKCQCNQNENSSKAFCRYQKFSFKVSMKRQRIHRIVPVSLSPEMWMSSSATQSPCHRSSHHTPSKGEPK